MSAFSLPAPIGVGLLWTQMFVFQTLSGAARDERDLSEWTTVFRLRNPAGDVVAQVTETASVNGSIVNSGVAGTLFVTLRSEATGALTRGTHTFEIDGVRADGQAERLLDGYVPVRSPRGLVVSARECLITRVTDAVLVEDARAVGVIKVERGLPGSRGAQGAQGEPGDGAALQTVSDATLPARPTWQVIGARSRDQASQTRSRLDLHQASIEEWGASSSDTLQSTITATAGVNSAQLDPSAGFEKGDWIFVPQGGAAHGFSAPSAPTVIVQGTPGGTTVSVRSFWYSEYHGYSALSPATVVTTANATLTAANFLEFYHDRAEALAAGACRIGYVVQIGGSGGTHTYRGMCLANPLRTEGGFAFEPSFRLHTNTAPATVPGVPANSAGWASSVTNGTWVRLTTEPDATTGVAGIEPPLKTSVTNGICYPDTAPAVWFASEYVPAGGTVVVPPRTYYFATPWRVKRPIFMDGRGASADVTSGAEFYYRAGAGGSWDNRTLAQKRAPGMPLFLGQRIMPSAQTIQASVTNKVYRVTGLPPGATIGYTATGADPAWNAVLDATTTDGEVTLTCETGSGDTSAGFEWMGICHKWQGYTIPANRFALVDDLQEGSYKELRSGSADPSTHKRWTAGMVSTSTNKWVFAPEAALTNKRYEATTPGTAGGSAPAFGRLIGGTVVDNTTTWTTRDVFWQQGCGILISVKHRTYSMGIDTCPGTGVIFNGDSAGNGGSVDYSTGMWRIARTTGHGAAAIGSDGHMMHQILHVDHHAGRPWVENSFYGNRVFVGNGGGSVLSGQIGFGGVGNSPLVAVQNRRLSSTQNFAIFEGYNEGATEQQDWNLPGSIGNGHNHTSMRSGATAPYRGSYDRGVNWYSASLDTFFLWSGETLRYATGAGTTGAGTSWQFDRTFQSSTGAHIQEWTAGDSEDVVRELFYNWRGRREEHLNGIGLGLNGCRLSATGALITTGSFQAGDELKWIGDSRFLAIRAERDGTLVGGAVPSARVNSTAYTRGQAFSSSGKAFVVVSAGTTASSPPAGLAAAAKAGFVLDGSCRVQCAGTDQDPRLTAIPNRNATPLVFAASTGNIDITSSPVFECPNTGSNFTKTLQMTGNMRGGGILVRNTSGGAGIWTFDNGGPGGGTLAVFPTLTDAWALFLNDGTDFYMGEWAGF